MSDPRQEAELRAEIRRLRYLLEEEQARHAKLLSSTSWKLTAPLRAAVEWLRRDTVTEAPATPRPPVPAPAFVPYQLRSIEETQPGDPNASLRRIDAADAMRPLLAGQSVDFNAAGRARIAAIASPELVSELAWDADVRALDEQRWQEQLRPGEFDYLLLEPVWHVDSRQWRYAMVADGGQQGPLPGLVGHCRRIGLPVVLWFREDADNYRHFAWLAGLADRTYALDDEMRERLAAEFPGRAIGVLPLAVQPRLHNPLRSAALHAAAPAFEGKVLVDGWWEVANGSAAASLAGFGEALRICDSEWDFSRTRLADSPGLAQWTLGCVGPVDKAALAKLFPAEVFLQSSLRLPWRRRLAMLRSAAAGCDALVLDPGATAAVDWPAAAAGDAGALREFLAAQAADPLRRSARAHRLAADIVQGHALADRLDAISADLGLERGRKEPLPRVAAVLVTMRPQLVPGCIERFRQDAYPNRELQIVLHGDASAEAVRALVRPGEPIHVHQLGRERSLGACLNYAVHQTDAPYWAKFDDDDIYGPRYLAETMAARRWFDFGLAGRPPAFTYIEGDQALYWEPAWAAMANLLHSASEPARVGIAGATLVGRRSLVEEVPLSERRRGGSDSDFILRSMAAGCDVVALDPFGFARFRSASADFHTHRFDHAELAARAVRVSDGEGLAGAIDP